MKNQLKILLTLVIATFYSNVNAQWQGPGVTGAGNMYFNNGNVGIGTTNPSKNLVVGATNTGSQISSVRRDDTIGNTNELASLLFSGSNADGTTNLHDGARIAAFTTESWTSTAFGTELRFYTSDNTASTLNQRMVINENGNVGIGTTSPDRRLHVNSSQDVIALFESSNQYARINLEDTATTNSQLILRNGDNTNFYTGGVKSMALNANGNVDISNGNLTVSNGNVGIGTTNPGSNLHINSPSSNSAILRFTRPGANTFGYEIGGSTYGLYDYTSGEYKWKTKNGDVLIAETSGNVSIGTTTPATGYKLSVAGKIMSEGVKVKLQSAGWPDYVFSKNYKLKSLSETEEYIKEEGHLPEIPSAEEVAENGIELGEMNAKLLQKIEELTLHLINQNKEIIEQNNKLESQQLRIEELERKLK